MVIEQAKEVLKIEAQSILSLVDRVGPEFEEAVEMILRAKGRVVLTGMGKSGLIGRKIVSTLNSTGTPSVFLHPAEAIHGDIGMVTKDDIVLAISNSGQTSEVNALLPILKNMGARIIAFTGILDSLMAKACDIVIDVGVEREACPLGLAPTASTTAALAMGDALAVALINGHRFKRDDFRRFHPGGSLGERLDLMVKEVMRTGDLIPVVTVEAKVQQAIEKINAKDIGVTLVVDRDQKVAGIITDGDLRRAMMKHGYINEMKVERIMSSSPKTIEENQTAEEALGLMELNGITHLVVVDGGNRPKGIVHFHDLFGREDLRANGVSKLTAGTHR